MITLFIDTSISFPTISLLKDNKILFNFCEEIKSDMSSKILPIIDEALNKINLEMNSIHNIFVVTGPGSFTGVRIGVTIAKTLAYTLNIPIKTITSLKAYAVSSDKETNKLVTIEDLKGKYIGYFDKNNNLLSDYTYLKNDEYERYIKEKEQYLN